VAPEVDGELAKQIEEMGFSTNRATRALHFTGNHSLEAAIDWIVQHSEDAGIDEPLLVPKASPCTCCMGAQMCPRLSTRRPDAASFAVRPVGRRRQRSS
jgi:UBA/TS-N domain